MCVVVVLAGCGDDSSETADGGAAQDAAAVVDSGPGSDGGSSFPASGPLVGTIHVYERDGPTSDGCGQEGIRGEIAARFTSAPMTSFHVETMNQDGCRLLEYRVGNCKTCNNGFCVFPSECRAFADAASASTMTLSGTKTPITMMEQFGGNYYPTEFPVPGELFDGGDPISVSATGDTIPAFTIAANGVATLDASFTNDEITLVDGQDFTFTWTPGGGATDRVRVTINATGIGHGTPKVAILECDGPDTGSLTIPKAFVEAFPDIAAERLCFGYDCACSSIVRYTRSSIDSIAGGDIELTVGSKIDFLVNHNPQGAGNVAPTALNP